MQSLAEVPAVCLLGPRQVGKTTLALAAKKKYDAVYLDLESEQDRAKLAEAELYLERYMDRLVILDEVQKIPRILDEVHLLIENHGYQFILCGSSARKLKRGHANLLGGRALRRELHPLVYPEIDKFSLSKAEIPNSWSNLS